MFELTIEKEALLAPLLIVAGAVDRKQSMTILSHFLLKLSDGFLSITATDLEIEITAQVSCQPKLSLEGLASITVPAKKFIDILRALDDQSSLRIVFHQDMLTIHQARSSFKLTTLPAEDYPVSEDLCNEIECTIPRLELLRLLQSTHFAMSQQDVRTFLNGLFLELEPNLLTAVASDGHRMAISHCSCPHSSHGKLLLPRKGVQELLRLLQGIPDEQVDFSVGKSHLKLVANSFTLLSKLIEARFPPYRKAIPRAQDKLIVVDGASLKRSLARIVILAHEKSKAVTLHLQSGQLTLIAHNNEQEEAVESLAAQTQGDELKIGFNATYLSDILNYLGEGEVSLSLSDTSSSILIESPHYEGYQYLIMPMKI